MIFRSKEHDYIIEVFQYYYNIKVFPLWALLFLLTKPNMIEKGDYLVKSSFDDKNFIDVFNGDVFEAYIKYFYKIKD